MARLLPKTKETLGQRAYREIRTRILDGQLNPGERLSLRRVASSMGMSMGPINEALRELNRDGLIEMETRWGARVRRIDRESLRNQCILRMALECEATRLCTRNASDGQLVDLMQLAQELDAQIDSHGDPQAVGELDSKFHMRIAQLSGAPVLMEMLKGNQLVRMLARSSLIAHDLNRPKQQHVALVEAIRKRDLRVAEDAMREHCQRSMDLQMANLRVTEEY